MTYIDALKSIIQHSTSSRSLEAVKILNRMEHAEDPGSYSHRADVLIRIVLDEERDAFPDASELEALIAHDPSPRRTVTVRFRCSENYRNVLGLLADKYAGGNISKLIVDSILSKYPTI